MILVYHHRSCLFSSTRTKSTKAQCRQKAITFIGFAQHSHFWTNRLPSGNEPNCDSAQPGSHVDWANHVVSIKQVDSTGHSAKRRHLDMGSYKRYSASLNNENSLSYTAKKLLLQLHRVADLCRSYEKPTQVVF